MSRRLIVLVLAASGVLAAQDPPSRAGRISYVSGAVSFEPAGVTDWVAANVNRPLTMGDQLYADNGARAEVNVPGAAFRLGDRTAFEFLNLDDRTVQVRLSEGTLDIRVRNLSGNLEVDTPNVAFTVGRPGEYRLDVNPDSGQTLVTARDGEGAVMAAGGSFTLHMGQQAVVRGEGQSAQYKINPAPGYDAFDHWVMSRNKQEDRYASSRYVSPEMVGYEDLGAYGTWRFAQDYGDVWVPNNVPAGWVPYRDGHWVWIDPWGWTWVDDEPWGFAPFHYGRWAFLNGYWGWCPGPFGVAPVYAPALVAWVGFGGGFGVSIGAGIGPAVGWFPLGPRDVYIPAFTASAAFVTRINVTNTAVINTRYVNRVYNTYRRTRSIPVASYMNRSVPGAVVAVPRDAFTSARPVEKVAMRISPRQIAAIRAARPAPRVAPGMASVLGRASAGSVPHPPAAVLRRQVVARTSPPAPPPSFQQRQALLARNPGRPLAVGQLHELARSGGSPALRPPVRVQNQSRPRTPQMAHAGTPRTQPHIAEQHPAQQHARLESRPPRAASAGSRQPHTAAHTRQASVHRAQAPHARAVQTQRPHIAEQHPAQQHARMESRPPRAASARSRQTQAAAHTRQASVHRAQAPHARAVRSEPPRREPPHIQARQQRPPASPARSEPRLQAMHRPPAMPREPMERQTPPERRPPPHH